MKKLLSFLVILGIAYFGLIESGPVDFGFNEPAAAEAVIAEAWENRQSDVQVAGRGAVTRVLADDNGGSRHQRFILRLDSGQTVLIAHNIDLAPRIPGLAEGDQVEFYGEYEWNERGGVIHWTHHDPQGRHVGGWLKHRGKTYQ